MELFIQLLPCYWQKTPPSTSNIAYSGTININMSDHLPVFLIRKKSRNKIEKHKTEGRSYIRYDKETFGRLLTQQDWSQFDNSVELDQMWNELELKIVKSLDVICPIRELLVSNSKPQWLNNEIIQVMRKRDMAYKKARKTKNEIDWRKAIFLRNRVESLIKTFKKDKIKNNLDRNRNNPTKFWKEIRSVIPQETTSVVNSLEDETTGVTYTSDELSDHINEYFATIGEKLANIIKSRRSAKLGYYQYITAYNDGRDGITNTPFAPDELRKAMSLIDTSKSSAITNIRAKVIIDAYDILFDRVLHLYNQSLQQAKFPSAWKISIVVPIPKVNNPKFAADLRPISLIPLPGKILEHLINSRLKLYISRNNILTPNQHGFRQGHSTITSVTSLLNDIFTNVNIYKDTFLIYLDLKKAFDTVSHQILLNKLGMFGIDMKTIEWFKSYLCNRQQYVKMNGINSTLRNIGYGVPQGSILGPTLFALFINDLAGLLHHKNVILYADDTVIYDSDPTKLQSMLDNTNEWCEENLLTVNCKKSQWMKTSIVHKHTANHTFKLGTNVLEQVREYRYLGLLLDTDMNFNSLRENVYKRINLKISFFKKIRKYIDVNMALTIYKSTVLPIIEYADFVYEQNIKFVNKKLQTLQNQGLYVVYNQHIMHYMQRDSTEILHRKAKMYRLCHRRKLHLLTFAYKLSQNDVYLDHRDIPTRQHVGKLFLIPKVDHYRFSQNPTYRAMYEWNLQPVEVRNSTSKTVLLTRLKRLILNPYMKVL